MDILVDLSYLRINSNMCYDDKQLKAAVVGGLKDPYSLRACLINYLNTKEIGGIPMSMIQKEVADFSVQSYQNNEFKTVTKKDILGKWSVFFFYPADFTFVCPTELEDLADNYDKFKEIGCEIYSVSCDTHFVHKAWHDASDTI